MSSPSRPGRGNKKHARKKHPNSHAREVALQALYQIEIGGHSETGMLAFSWLNEPMPEKQREYCTFLVQSTRRGRDLLDREIETRSHKHISQISTIDRNILRMGILELKQGEIAREIVIDDYLNLTRIYDGEESVGFVNGILDAIEAVDRKDSETEVEDDG